MLDAMERTNAAPRIFQFTEAASDGPIIQTAEVPIFDLILGSASAIMTDTG
jgi:hypothetical protein